MNFKNPNYIDRVLEILIRPVSTHIYRDFINEITLKPNHKVLEFGCGTGNLSVLLIKKLKHGELVCIDTSPYMIQTTRKRLRKYSNKELILEDITEYKEKNNYFDSILIHLVLHDIPKPERMDIIKSLVSKLKKKGRIYIKESTKPSHGMSEIEIKELMKHSKLKEIKNKNSKVTFRGESFFGIYEK